MSGAEVVVGWLNGWCEDGVRKKEEKEEKKGGLLFDQRAQIRKAETKKCSTLQCKACICMYYDCVIISASICICI